MRFAKPQKMFYNKSGITEWEATMFRLILAVPFLLLLLIISPFAWLFFLIVRIFSRKASDTLAVGFIRGACSVAKVLCGTKLTVIGHENIPQNRAVVYAMNHRSIFDIILSYPYTRGRTGFIAKKELSKVPVFSTWLWFANCLFLDRKNIREGLKTIRKGIENVQNGISMCIFPEGTRNKDRESLTSLLEFHDASFKLAERPNAPIIPVAVYNSAECFENHKPFFKSCPVVILIGKPVIPSDLPQEDRRFIGRYMQSVIQEMLYKCESIAAGKKEQ